MKSILKIVLVFVLGVAVGGGVAGFIISKMYQSLLVRTHSLTVAGDIGLNAMRARSLREGDVETVLKSAENNLMSGILLVQGNGELKNARVTESALNVAKEFYVCTKTEYPPEIAVIMNDLPAVPEDSCNISDDGADTIPEKPVTIK